MTRLALLALFLMVSTPVYACQLAGVSISADFSNGRLDGCALLDKHHIALTFKPENRPINSSGWYAFKVSSQQPQQITFSLSFDGDLPRYLPKLSRDGKNWQALPFRLQQGKFIIELSLNKNTLWIAGQEIIDNQYYLDWMQGLLTTADSASSVSQFELGKSTEKRPIYGLKSIAPTGKEWLLVIGRQHPPEVTGALALLAFVERLLGQSQGAKAFRQRFNLMIVPNLNPDGVEHGHWRHNSQGVDLNRDWNKFEQVETRLIKAQLESLQARGHKLVFALDFHSTREDVFYTIPPSADIAPKQLVITWLDDLNLLTKNMFITRDKPGNRPGRGIFKQYIADEFNVHGVTFEVGDHTDRQLLSVIASATADTLMQRLLATAPESFYLEQQEQP